MTICWPPVYRRGLPIGNLTSQFWANCYLSSFDHFVTRELRPPAYLRYVDDFLLSATIRRNCGRVVRRSSSGSPTCA